jgi:hypothetical protein
MNTELHGLQKHANYSIQVWAYTHVGDGVKSNPIFCITEEAGKVLLDSNDPIKLHESFGQYKLQYIKREPTVWVLGYSIIFLHILKIYLIIQGNLKFFF